MSFSDYAVWLKVHFGKSLEIPTSVVMGIIISAYVLLFIGTHVEELKRIISINKKDILS